jgi:hypothetical protein
MPMISVAAQFAFRSSGFDALVLDFGVNDHRSAWPIMTTAAAVSVRLRVGMAACDRLLTDTNVFRLTTYPAAAPCNKPAFNRDQLEAFSY